MQLKKSGRETYRLRITTTPAVAAWEASFDDEATWVAGTATTYDIPDGEQNVPVHEWLVRGPNAAAGSAVAVITRNVRPVIRATANPEIIVRNAKRIYLTA